MDKKENFGKRVKEKIPFEVNLKKQIDPKVDWPRINFLMEIQDKTLMGKLPFFLVEFKDDEIPFIKGKLKSLVTKVKFKLLLNGLASANMPEAKKLLFLARYGFFLRRIDKNWYRKTSKLLNDLLIKIEAVCPSLIFQKIDFEVISKENYRQKTALLKEIAELYKDKYRAPVSSTGLVKRSLRGDDVNEYNEIFYRLTSFFALCLISSGVAIGVSFKTILGFYWAGIGGYIGFYLWCQGYFKSFKLYRKKPPAMHEFAILAGIEKRFSESKRCFLLVAKVGNRPVGFFFAADLRLVRTWPRIFELGGSFTLPEFQRKGITLLATIMLRREADTCGKGIDYCIDISTTFHPLITVLSEKSGFKPIGLEIGGLRDYYGYYTENCQNVDYANYVLLASDYLGTGIFKKNKSNLFILKKYKSITKKIFENFGAKRMIYIPKEQKAKADFKGLAEFMQQLKSLKKDESAGLMIDLCKPEAPTKMTLAEKEKFYFCGILPSAFDGKKYCDYAYYRYLSEERTVYPFISLYGFGIPDKGNLKAKLKKTMTKSFNAARVKNKLFQSFGNPLHWSD